MTSMFKALSLHMDVENGSDGKLKKCKICNSHYAGINPERSSCMNAEGASEHKNIRSLIYNIK